MKTVTRAQFTKLLATDFASLYGRAQTAPFVLWQLDRYFSDSQFEQLSAALLEHGLEASVNPVYNDDTTLSYEVEIATLACNHPLATEQTKYTVFGENGDVLLVTSETRGLFIFTRGLPSDEYWYVERSDGVVLCEARPASPSPVPPPQPEIKPVGDLVQHGLFGNDKRLAPKPVAPVQRSLFPLFNQGAAALREMENSIPLHLSFQDTRTAAEVEADALRAARNANLSLPTMTAIVPVSSPITLNEATFRHLINAPMRERLSLMRSNLAAQGGSLVSLVQYRNQWSGQRGAFMASYVIKGAFGTKPHWVFILRDGETMSAAVQPLEDETDKYVFIADLKTTAIVPVGERRTLLTYSGVAPSRPPFAGIEIPADATCEICSQPAAVLWNNHYVCRSCDGRILAYSDKRSARADRIQLRAEKTYADGKRHIDRAHEMASVIPFGQPILIGHHSEKRDRRYRERIHTTYGRGFALLERSKQIARRADAATNNHAISSDDPAAILKLQSRIESAERLQAEMKRVNEIVRSLVKPYRSKPLSRAGTTLAERDAAYMADLQARRAYEKTYAQYAAALAERAGISEEAARRLLKADELGRIGFANYLLSNNTANIRRMKDRLEALKRRQRQVAAADEQPQRVEIAANIYAVRNLEENRLQIFFPDKPDAAIRQQLKSLGFKWSPSASAWQRHLNNGAEYALTRVVYFLTQ